MKDNWTNYINSILDYRKKKYIYRDRKITSNGNDRLIYYDNKWYINFSSNNYLGLARHPEVINAWKKGALKTGVGSSGSGHTVGYGFYHYRLEERLSNWLGYQRALLFPSGFTANQSVISTLVNYNDYILIDKLSHASLLKASINSKAKFKRFAHNDLVSLKNFFKKKYCGRCLVVTEGVFSMDGDYAPISDLLSITKKEKAWLMVDDAHGIGVIGKKGRGCSCFFKTHPDILIVTFGKSFGVNGAAVLCTDQFAEYLLQCSCHLIYSTAIPSAQVFAIDTALTIIQNSDELRDKLKDNISYFRHGASNIGITLSSSDTAIQPIIIGDNLKSIQLVKELRKYGVWLTAIRPPTVPIGTARLRVTLTAIHKNSDIDTLLEALSNAQKKI